jgi:hypothetical protein
LGQVVLREVKNQYCSHGGLEASSNRDLCDRLKKKEKKKENEVKSK